MPEVNSAEVVKGDGQETEIEVTANAGAEQAGEADAETVDSETDRPPKKGGWLRKLEKAERQRDELIQALARVGGNAGTEQKQTAQVAEDKPPVKPTRPKASDFQEYEKYEAAVEKYEEDRDQYTKDIVAYEVKAGMSKADQAKQQKSERQVITDGFAKQCDELRKEHEDFDDVAFNKSVPMSDAMQEAILTSEHGAKIAYELGQDPDEAERIAHLSPVAAIREIGKIESRIASKKSAAEDDEEADEPEPPKAASQAPKPPARVGRPTSVNSEPDDKEPYDKWLKKRNAQLRK